MSSQSKSGTTFARRSRFLSAVACLALSCALATPSAHAGEGGMTGWAFCTTYAPYSSAYVAGDPVYVSEVFHVDSMSGEVGTLWRNFLKQKYGWTKSANCSIATGSTGQAAQLRDSAQFKAQAGPKLVNTAWTVGMSGATSAAPAPTPAQSAPQTAAATPASTVQGSLAPGGILYWVCTWFTKNSTVFISDAFSASNKLGPTELVPPFTNFVVAKHGATPHWGSASCVYKFKEEDAQSYLKQRIAQPPSGMHVVQTGWKYGMTASGGVAPTTQGASAPAAAPAAVSGAVSAQSQAGPPVITNITVRLVDAVNSSTDPGGKRYRAVVTKEATAGRAQIPQNTLASITLAQQSAGVFSLQLVSLKLDGQDVQVSSTAVTATSTAQQAQQAAKKIGGFLSGLGKKSAAANEATGAISTAGNHVTIPPGTSLTFSTSVPQPGLP